MAVRTASRAGQETRRATPFRRTVAPARRAPQPATSECGGASYDRLPVPRRTGLEEAPRIGRCEWFTAALADLRGDLLYPRIARCEPQRPLDRRFRLAPLRGRGTQDRIRKMRQRLRTARPERHRGRERLARLAIVLVRRLNHPPADPRGGRLRPPVLHRIQHPERLVRLSRQLEQRRANDGDL